MSSSGSRKTVIHFAYDETKRLFIVVAICFVIALPLSQVISPISCSLVTFLQAVASIDLPEIFRPETTDVYDAKNIPRVIYCLHALSLFLYKLGKAPQMLDLTGKATFTAEQISAMRSALDDYGLPMPQFRRIGGKAKFLQY